jgi:hypothetical protein
MLDRHATCGVPLAARRREVLSPLAAALRLERLL